jgi:hypothetical protein
MHTGFCWGSLNVRKHLEVSLVDLKEIGTEDMDWILLNQDTVK